MKILAINQFYAPDEAATAQMLTDLCEDLSVRGHSVSVLASRGGYRGDLRLPSYETRSGVRVFRAWSSSFGKHTLARRGADYASFLAGALVRASTLGSPDVVLALTTPPGLGAVATLLAQVRGAPAVLWVQDVYPEAAVALGAIDEQGAVTRAVRVAQRLSYRSASWVVALSDCMRDRLFASGAPPGRVSVIRNWADGKALVPRERRTNPFRMAHGFADRFVAMYSGNLGAGHDFSTFARAAKALVVRAPNVVFVFVGDGSRHAEAKSLMGSLPNVLFLPHQPRRLLGESLTAADVHLVSLRTGLEGLLVPSKVYGAMATARPIAFVGPARSEVSQVVRDNGIGWTGEVGSGGGLASYIEDLERSPMLCSEVGTRSRATFERLFDRPVAVSEWERLLQSVVEAGA